MDQHQIIKNSLTLLQDNIRNNYLSDLALNSSMQSFEEYNSHYYGSLNLCIEKFNRLSNILNTHYLSELAKSHNKILELIKNKNVNTYEEGLVIEQERLRNELIDKNDKEYREIWKDLLMEIPKISSRLEKALQTPHEQKCWISNFTALNSHRNILKEINEKIPNQILIEGYTEEYIDNQIDIRQKYIDNKFKSRNLHTMKRYYGIIHNQISRFKYFKMECAYNIANRKRITNKNLNNNAEYDFELNSYNIKKFFSNDIYEQIDKNSICTPIDFEIINNLISLDTNNMSIKGSRSIVDYLIYIVMYLTQIELLKFMDKSSNRPYYADFCYEFIWKNNIEKSEILNMMSEKDVKTHLRNILANENKNRLDKFKELSGSKKMLHKLKRDLGLGNLSVPDDETDINAIQDESEIMEEIENQYNAGDLVAQERILQQSEEQTNARIDLLGVGLDEAARQLAREFIERDEAENQEAEKEFNFSRVRGELDDEDDEFLDE
jgi:hypothetical protein